MLSLFDPPIASQYLIDFLGGKTGVHDEDWGPLLNPKDDWIVITRDLGHARKNKAKGIPLPLVLPRCKVTGVFLSGGLGHASRFEMVRAVTCVLPDIFAECSREPRGTRFRIRHDHGNFALNQWPTKKGESDGFAL